MRSTDAEQATSATPTDNSRYQSASQFDSRGNLGKGLTADIDLSDISCDADGLVLREDLVDRLLRTTSNAVR